MPNSLCLGAPTVFSGCAMLQLLFGQYSENTDILDGKSFYFSMLATYMAGESLLNKRRTPCIFVAFQGRHLEMH